MTKQRIEAVEPWENQPVQAEPEPAWDASMRLAKPQPPQELKPVNDWVKPFERFWTQQADRIKQRAEEKAAGEPIPGLYLLTRQMIEGWLKAAAGGP